MTKRIAAFTVILAALALAVPASVLAAQAGKSATSQRAAVSGIRADVTCHDPCDDPFQLKAWVRGGNVGGLMVKFTVKGKTVPGQDDEQRLRPLSPPHPSLELPAGRRRQGEGIRQPRRHHQDCLDLVQAELQLTVVNA